VAKLVLDEPESAALGSFLAGARLASSALLEVELTRAVLRSDPSRLDRAETVLSAVFLIELDQPVRRAAGRLEPPTIRSLDAVHVASALALGETLDAFVSYDGRQTEGAKAAGLAVESPA
jgi:hypothetical protein